MKQKKQTLFKMLLFGGLLVSFTTIKAQDLLVNLESGTTENYSISEIRSLTFEETAMVINQNDGTTISFEINDISSYSFDLTNSLDNLTTENNLELKIYPNPSSSLVNISYLSQGSDKISIEIIDQSGRVIKELYNGNHNNNKTEVVWDINSSESISTGTYICKVVNGNKMITKSIIVQ